MYIAADERDASIHPDHRCASTQPRWRSPIKRLRAPGSSDHRHVAGVSLCDLLFPVFRARRTNLPVDRIFWEDWKDHFRRVPGKDFELFHAPHPINCTLCKTSPAAGQVTELIFRPEDGDGATKKAKPSIQWVTSTLSDVQEQQLSAAVPDFKADINRGGREIVECAMVKIGFWALAR